MTMPETTCQEAISIRFPALSFNQGWVHLVRDMDHLSRSSKKGFKRGLHKDLLVVDFNGNMFRIVDARKVRTLIDLNVNSLLGLLSGNPGLQLELSFASPSKINVEHLKKLISDCFKRHEAFWEEMSDFEDFRTKISAAVSVDEIFSVFKAFKM